jgi:CRISPR-associated endonuclease Cas2
MMKNYLIAYDVFKPKRLYKVKKIAYSYAFGGQKSAVEAPLDKISMSMLISELKSTIKPEDKVNIIKIVDTILIGKAKTLEYDNGVVIL